MKIFFAWVWNILSLRALRERIFLSHLRDVMEEVPRLKLNPPHLTFGWDRPNYYTKRLLVYTRNGTVLATICFNQHHVLLISKGEGYTDVKFFGTNEVERSSAVQEAMRLAS